MIGFLTGNIISLKPTKLLLDVNGVGYNVNISINTFEKISDKKEVSLFIYTNVKEDSITLFGFYSETEKEMFEHLISVNGIGPKLGQNILSGIQVEDLQNAIQIGDVSRIVAIPGIGRKTAERVILELKGKVDSVSSSGELTTSFTIKNEATSALTTLGYNIKIAENIVREILAKNPNSTLEELIKLSLSLLNKGK